MGYTVGTLCGPNIALLLTQLDREKVENKLLQNDSSCTARCSSLSQSRRSRIESTFPLFLSSLAFQQQLQLYLRQMDCGPSCVPSTWRQGTQYTYTGSASLAQNVKARGGRGSICPACPLNPRHTSTCKVFKVSQFHEKRFFCFCRVSEMFGIYDSSRIARVVFAGHLANALWSNYTICQTTLSCPDVQL